MSIKELSHVYLHAVNEPTELNKNFLLILILKFWIESCYKNFQISNFNWITWTILVKKQSN